MCTHLTSPVPPLAALALSTACPSTTSLLPFCAQLILARGLPEASLEKLASSLMSDAEAVLHGSGTTW